MLAWSQRTIAWLCLALVVGVSCSVFPDEATLPLHSGAGSAGQAASDDGGTGAGGHGDVFIPEGGVAGQSIGSGGVPAGSGGSGGGVMPLGGAGNNAGGAAGEGGGGGTPPCVNPQTLRVPADFDTWIGSAKPTNNHGTEKVLDVAASVVAGTDEQRALIAFTVPQMLLGAELRRATLRLHLESNADAGLAGRRLGVHQLTKDFEEGRATWNENVKNTAWATKGGDFVASQLDGARITAGTSSGNVDFNLTASIAQLLGPAPIPLSLIILESGAARPAPAELAFASTEGNASLIPELLLDYCDP